MMVLPWIACGMAKPSGWIEAWWIDAQSLIFAVDRVL